MATRLERLQQWLNNNQAISFKHIKKEGNKLADFLANFGVDSGKEFFAGSLQGIASENQLSTFHSILTRDMLSREEPHPDVGVNM